MNVFNSFVPWALLSTGTLPGNHLSFSTGAKRELKPCCCGGGKHYWRVVIPGLTSGMLSKADAPRQMCRGCGEATSLADIGSAWLLVSAETGAWRAVQESAPTLWELRRWNSPSTNDPGWGFVPVCHSIHTTLATLTGKYRLGYLCHCELYFWKQNVQRTVVGSGKDLWLP